MFTTGDWVKINNVDVGVVGYTGLQDQFGLIGVSTLASGFAPAIGYDIQRLISYVPTEECLIAYCIAVMKK